MLNPNRSKAVPIKSTKSTATISPSIQSPRTPTKGSKTNFLIDGTSPSLGDQTFSNDVTSMIFGRGEGGIAHGADQRKQLFVDSDGTIRSDIQLVESSTFHETRERAPISTADDLPRAAEYAKRKTETSVISNEQDKASSTSAEGLISAHKEISILIGRTKDLQSELELQKSLNIKNQEEKEI